MRVPKRHAAAAAGLIAMLGSGGLAVASEWPDSIPSFGVALGSGATGLSARMAGHSPALSVGPITLSLISEAHLYRTSGWRDARLLTGALAEHTRGGITGWLGLGVESGGGTRPRSTPPTAELGIRAQSASLALLARARQRRLDVPQAPRLVLREGPGFPAPPDSTRPALSWETSEPRSTAVTMLETAFHWSWARWDLETELGLAVAQGVSPLRLARARAARWLLPRLSVGLDVSGAAPRWLTNEPTDGPSAKLGVDLALGRGREEGSRGGAETGAPPWRWSARRLGEDRFAFRFRGPGVARVALRGDFTGWEPVALARAGIGWWEATLPVSRGVHHLEISVDGGAWQAPPGLPTTAGAYGGEVGLMVVD